MSIVIQKYAPGATIQDIGRYGYQHLGINPSGAMDLVALYVANALIANKPSEAVIEFIFPAPIFYFTKATFIALSGADFCATSNGFEIPINQAVFMPAGGTLQFNKKKKGNFCYLAAQGGFRLDDWLGSYSTNIKARAGGLNGGFLQKNDQLFLKKNTQSVQHSELSILPWRADISSFYEDTIDFTEGPEYHYLSVDSKQALAKAPFAIQSKSDRMGYYLSGPALNNLYQTELISSAATKGTIQLLPNEQVIVLMADHQTTGGYPRIGTVSDAAQASLAQYPFLRSFTFNKLSLQDSIAKLQKQERNLRILQQACILRAKEHF